MFLGTLAAEGIFFRFKTEESEAMTIVAVFGGSNLLLVILCRKLNALSETEY